MRLHLHWLTALQPKRTKNTTTHSVHFTKSIEANQAIGTDNLTKNRLLPHTVYTHARQALCIVTNTKQLHHCTMNLVTTRCDVIYYTTPYHLDHHGLDFPQLMLRPIQRWPLHVPCRNGKER